MSCTAQAPVNTSPPSPSVDQTALQNEIRPGSKGQRLEFTSLEGEMLVPAGTSAFTLQSTETRMGLLSLLIAPAYAQSSEDMALDMTLLKGLQATVNGEPVEWTVLSVTTLDTGEDRLHYRLEQVPVSESNAVIEISSPSGAFKLKGVLPKIVAGAVSVLSEPLDLDSTALVEVLQQSGEALSDLDADEIRELKRSATVQQVRAIIQAHLVEPRLTNNKPQRFEEAVRPLIQAGGQLARFQQFISQRKNCRQRPALCREALKLLNQSGSLAVLPERLQAKIKQRTRLRLGADASISPQASASPAAQGSLACLRFPSRPACAGL
ncbi:MAG: hypothetical protein ACO1RX_05220 [Candidatus Sericytochromatia bacterium]